MTTQQALKVLEISAGARSKGSISRQLTGDLVSARGSIGRFSPIQTRWFVN